MPNPYVNKVVQSNGTTLIDISDTTAVAADVASGKYFYLATGEKVEGTNSGGGDEPSEPTYETYFDDSINVGEHGISIASLADLYFAQGETWRVTWDGVEYMRETSLYQGWIWYIGNESLTGSGTDTGEPFVLYNYGGDAMNGNARTGGTHTLKLEKQTSSGGSGGSATLITKSITANGTYSASDDSADGYSSVTVNVPTGGTTTPYYMWRDSNSYVHISTTEHNGYQINVSSVEEHSTWSTVYEATISNWTQVNNCYEYEASVAINIDSDITFRVTYDGTAYTLQSVDGLIGSDVYGWDGTSAIDYPFGIMSGGDVIWIDVTTNGTHTIKIERLG